MQKTYVALFAIMVFSAPAVAADGIVPTQSWVVAQAMSAAPVPGANSFTESQAKDRIAKAGYSDVSGLRKDDQGVWRGTATKSGKSVGVSVVREFVLQISLVIC